MNLEDLSPAELEMEQLRRALARGERSINENFAAIAAISQKQIRRHAELARQTEIANRKSQIAKP